MYETKNINDEFIKNIMGFLSSNPKSIYIFRSNKNKVFELMDVNMSFEDGKIYAFTGRNGSGKSVLLKIISVLFKPTGGEVLYDGIDIFQ